MSEEKQYLEITNIRARKDGTNRSVIFSDDKPFVVSADWMKENEPSVGGFYVLAKGGAYFANDLPEVEAFVDTMPKIVTNKPKAKKKKAKKSMSKSV